ncbi:lipid-A-disaccharide synthase [Achromatium sp. WMS1]|nr:lipid-A-disaccharide synthase [Achromatium sp. WMS1]
MSPVNTQLRIGIVACEPSADQLGAGLIKTIHQLNPHTTFEGVGGPLMQNAGCNILLPMEELSVMGLFEVIHHLPRLLQIRRYLTKHFLTNQPHIFIGIDAPDFNLGLEWQLRRAKIPTIHYVSPTIWAWRPQRVHKMRQAADLTLSIFPFEVPLLKSQNIPVCYVGHPLADKIPIIPDQAAARIRLGLANQQILALLPGSRISEVRLLIDIFLKTANWCYKRHPQLYFIIPLVNATIRNLVEKAWQSICPEIPLILVDGNSHTVLAAANAVLTASGTATLEALLHKRPMVVAYRLNPLTYWLVKNLNLIKVPTIALANILSPETLAPEFIQDACQPEKLGSAILNLLNDPQRISYIQQHYKTIHEKLRCNSNLCAAEAVLKLT